MRQAFPNSSISRASLFMIKASEKKSDFPTYAAAKAYAIANINFNPIVRPCGSIYTVEIDHSIAKGKNDRSLRQAQEQLWDFEAQTERQQKTIATQSYLIKEQKEEIAALKEALSEFEQALNETFGKDDWEIRIETANTESYQTCNICMGNGGAGGNCYKCEGRGGKKVPIKRNKPILVVK